jgi:hypothetical protein
VTGRHPAPIVAVAAINLTDLRGRRAIVGVPGMGFRPDLRADNPVPQHGGLMVPILSEQDFYRAEIEQMETFAVLVPIERVWIEQVQGVGDMAGDLPTIDHPRVREPVCALGAPSLLGLRVVQEVPDGHIRDLRAVTDVYDNITIGLAARVCGEAEWYRWAVHGTVPSTTEILASQLWLE